MEGFHGNFLFSFFPTKAGMSRFKPEVVRKSARAPPPVPAAVVHAFKEPLGERGI